MQFLIPLTIAAVLPLTLQATPAFANPSTTDTRPDTDTILSIPAQHGRWVATEAGHGRFLGRYTMPAGLTAVALPDDAPEALRDLAPDSIYARGITAQFVSEITQGRVDATGLRVQAIERSGGDVIVQTEQTINGVPVEGRSAVTLVRDGVIVFANINLAMPSAIGTTAQIDAMEGASLALAVGRQMAQRAEVRGEPTLVVLDREQALAWRVELKTEEPYGAHAAFIDAIDGAPIRTDKISTDAVEGKVRFKVEPVCVGQGTEMVGMPNVQWNSGQYADDEGKFRADSASNATVALESPYFNLVDQSKGIDGPWSFPLSDGYNELDITNATLDQVDPFYNAHRTRVWLRSHIDDDNAQKRWTETQVGLNVNINSSCNAYYDGTINFFRAGNGCLNTGQVAIVVAHEYGHGIHHKSVGGFGGAFDGQLSEGIGDYIGATIVNSPQIVGLRGCNDPFRTCANDYTYCNSGCKYGPGSPVHASGQVICAVFWELRQQLIERYDYDQGVATANTILLKHLLLAPRMSDLSTYDAAIASDDDDDGDPSNGTKHSCEINKAFANDEDGAVAHFRDLVGKVPNAPSVKIEHDAPGAMTPDGSIHTLGGSTFPGLVQGEGVALDFFLSIDQGCAPDATLESLTFVYQELPSQVEYEVEMELVGDTTRGEQYRVILANLPTPVTLRYFVRAVIGGSEFIYPYQGSNRSIRNYDGYPHYRQKVYVGDAAVEKSWDFEMNDGGLLTTACTRDGKVCDEINESDWEWGEVSEYSGGPSEAHSGNNMWSTKPAGQYTRSRESRLHLPPLDARTLSEVRVQFWHKLFSSDRIRIEVNGQQAYERAAGGFFWRDPVWLFEDVDITRFASGKEAVEIVLIADDKYDDSFELAGWHVDDLQVRAVGGMACPVDVCGIKGPEAHDVTYGERTACAAHSTTDASLLSILALGLLHGTLLRRRRQRKPARTNEK